MGARVRLANRIRCVSVSESNVSAVIGYIAMQEEHHRKRTFQEEYLAFLKKNNVTYEERYIWT